MISQGGMECFYWDWQLTAAGFGALVGLAGLIAFIVGSEAVRRGSPGAASYGPGVVTIACAFGCLALAVTILLARHGQLNPCAYPGDPPRSDYLGWAQAGLTVAGALAVGGAYRLWAARRSRKEIAGEHPYRPSQPR